MSSKRNTKYKIKELFLTLQGEGFNTGKVSIFCRFSGCNLWNGIEKHRENSICSFCDTDFKGTDGLNGGSYNLKELLNKIDEIGKDLTTEKFIVFTGGEPLLQLDVKLIRNLKKKKYVIAIETNGTILPPNGIDWICVSPKAGSKTLLKEGNEIKIIYPQKDIDLKLYEGLNFNHFYLQPMYNKNYKNNLKRTMHYILKNPKWRLSLQTHKYLGIK